MEPRSPVLRLRPFDAARDARALVSWIPDAPALRLFAGDDASWPFTESDAARPGNPAARAWTAVERDALADEEPGGGPAVGHVEIVPDGAVVERRGHGEHGEHGANGPRVVRLARIVLSPEVRGRGWGALLVEAAVRQAEADGAVRVGLNVVPGNAPALRAYARAGFADRGRNPAHPSYVWMERTLRQS